MVMEDFLGAGESDMSLEVRIFELQQSLQKTCCLHPSKVHSNNQDVGIVR